MKYISYFVKEQKARKQAVLDHLNKRPQPLRIKAVMKEGDKAKTSTGKSYVWFKKSWWVA